MGISDWPVHVPMFLKPPYVLLLLSARGNCSRLEVQESRIVDLQTQFHNKEQSAGSVATCYSAPVGSRVAISLSLCVSVCKKFATMGTMQAMGPMGYFKQGSY